VHINNVSIVNSPDWSVRIDNSERIFVQGVYIYSSLTMGVNGDGIDLVSSRDVAISDSVITTGDDSIVLKTIPMNGTIKPTENVTVTNCILTSSSTALMIGTETFADIRHVVFSNIVIRNANKGFGINVQDGATVSDVVVSNVTMELNRRHWNWWGSAERFKIVLKKREPRREPG
jgi:polygalacturonase